MQFKTIKIGNVTAARLIEDGTIIRTVQDALDLLANAGETTIVLKKSQLNADFFELRTGFAGEVMQKLVNYGVKVVVVGDFSNIESKSLHDFIYECNSSRSTGGGMRFVERV